MASRRRLFATFIHRLFMRANNSLNLICGIGVIKLVMVMSKPSSLALKAALVVPPLCGAA